MQTYITLHTQMDMFVSPITGDKLGALPGAAGLQSALVCLPDLQEELWALSHGLSQDWLGASPHHGCGASGWLSLFSSPFFLASLHR